MPWGRRLAFVVCFCSILAFGAPNGITRAPEISFAEDAPADLRRVATETWRRFLGAFPNQRTCIPPVTVAGAWSHEDRAAYQPELRLVTVRVPATRPNLQAAFVHEFAHHLEFTCPDQRDVRARFLAAQGFGAGASWWRGADWESTPSEHWAEAAVVMVLGTRPSHVRIGISPESLDVLREWAEAR